MDEGEEMSLDRDVEDLKKHVGALDDRIEVLEDHRQEHVDPTLRRLEDDIVAMRADLRIVGVKIDNCASKDDVIQILNKMDDSNKNLATALATPSKDQADRTANATMWWTGIMAIATIATVVVALVSIHK